MKKIIFLSLFCLLSQTTFAYTTCKSALQSSKPFLILYTANSCFACKKFKPIYNQTSLDFADKFNFVIIDVQKIKKHDFCTKINIQYIPSVVIVEPKTRQKALIDNSTYWNLKVFKSELEKYLALIIKK